MPTDRNKCQVIFRTMLLQIILKATKIFTKGNKPHKKTVKNTTQIHPIFK